MRNETIIRNGRCATEIWIASARVYGRERARVADPLPRPPPPPPSPFLLAAQPSLRATRLSRARGVARIVRQLDGIIYLEMKAGAFGGSVGHAGWIGERDVGCSDFCFIAERYNVTGRARTRARCGVRRLVRSLVCDRRSPSPTPPPSRRNGSNKWR